MHTVLMVLSQDKVFRPSLSLIPAPAPEHSLFKEISDTNLTLRFLYFRHQNVLQRAPGS